MNIPGWAVRSALHILNVSRHCHSCRFHIASPIRRMLIPKRYLNTGRHAVIPACGSRLLFTIYLTSKKKVFVCCQVIQSRFIAKVPFVVAPHFDNRSAYHPSIMDLYLFHTLQEKV